MVAKNKSARRPAARKFTITRIFAAPRALVFAAWTEPRHLKQWSAPHGFTIPHSDGELKPGGKWRACMCTPDGHELWLSGVYLEVVPDELIVFTHAWEENGVRQGETQVKVTFADHGRGTKMVFEQSGFDSAGSRQGHRGGWTQCFDRLAALLVEIKKPKKSHGRNKK